MLMARYINDISNKVMRQGASFAQAYLLNKGLKKYGKKGQDASVKELDQLHRRNSFTPILIAEMSPIERRKAQQALMFLTEKRDQTIKGRMVYNGKPTSCLLYTSDAADDMQCVDLGGRRIIKKNFFKQKTAYEM